MRARPAPRALRTAISFWRAEARARSMWATLAQAISSTNPTAPKSTSKRRLDLADDVLFEGRHC